MPELTRLLQQLDGDPSAADADAIASFYDEIRRLARGCMRGERADHTLAPTALANEAFLRLFGARPQFASGAEFLAAAVTTLRRILVEHWRRRSRQRRGGDRQRSPIDADSLAAPEPDARLLDLDAALQRLAALDLHKARLVELRFFAGLSVAEAAAVLGLSERTAARDWRLARAFLRAELGGAGGDELDD